MFGVHIVTLPFLAANNHVGRPLAHQRMKALRATLYSLGFWCWTKRTNTFQFYWYILCVVYSCLQNFSFAGKIVTNKNKYTIYACTFDFENGLLLAAFSRYTPPCLSRLVWQSSTDSARARPGCCCKLSTTAFSAAFFAVTTADAMLIAAARSMVERWCPSSIVPPDDEQHAE